MPPKAPGLYHPSFAIPENEIAFFHIKNRRIVMQNMKLFDFGLFRFLSRVISPLKLALW